VWQASLWTASQAVGNEVRRGRGEPEAVFITEPGRNREVIYSHPGFRVMKGRFGINNEKELTPEMLQTYGVNVHWIDLVQLLEGTFSI
jgi:hypothetical protein